jgi:chaperone modulatory protein CbpM
MTILVTDVVLLDESGVCSLAHLAEVSGLAPEDIADLVDSGLMQPAQPLTEPPRFYLRHVTTVRLARRLRDDFELDRNGLALAMTLMRRIEALEQDLHNAQSRLGGNAAP